LGAPVNFNLLLPKHPSQNVIARPAATGRRGAPDVVIVAHYDVQWASWLFAPWFVRLLQPFFIAAYVGVVLAVIAAAARWLAPGAGWAGGAASAAAWILALAGGFLFVSWLTGGPSPGANDNGSGVAVALALAERWTEAARGGGTAGGAALTPWFVFTGCEEVGVRGVHRFLADADLPKDTIFLNIDNVGGGRLRYFLGEGMLAYQRYDAGLIELAAEVSRYSGDQVKPLKNWLLPTDGLLPAKAGYRALSFLALCDDHRIPNYHWHTDTIDNVDRSVVELTEQFLWDCLQAVAARRPPAAGWGRGKHGGRPQTACPAQRPAALLRGWGNHVKRRPTVRRPEGALCSYGPLRFGPAANRRHRDVEPVVQSRGRRRRGGADPRLHRTGFVLGLRVVRRGRGGRAV